MTSLTGSSIASRQLRSLLIGGVTISLLAGVLVIGFARHALFKQFDESLASRAEFLLTLADYSEEGILEFEEEAATAIVYSDRENPDYFQVWTLRPQATTTEGQFTTLDRSESLVEDDENLACDVPALVGAPSIVDAVAPDGRAARAVTLRGPVTRFDDEIDEDHKRRLLAEGTEIVVVVLAGTESITPLLLRISLGVAIACGAMIISFVALSLATVRRGLRQIEATNRIVGSIDASSLTTRVDVNAAPSELRPFLEGINNLLARLEDSFTRERIARAMLAHELRNPVAELLMTAEVAQRWPDDAELQKKQMSLILSSARDLQGMIGTLLRISRVQAGQEKPQWQVVEVSGLMDETVSCCAGLAMSRGLSIDGRIAPEIETRSDPDLLRFVMTNLLTNAVEHASPGGEISVRLSNGGGSIRMVCENTVSDPASIDCGEITRAFRTSSAVHSNGERHAGIGLTAVGSICAALGATVSLGVEEDRFVAEVAIPATGR